MTYEQLPIVGPQKITVFGQEIDLSVYNNKETAPPKIMSGDFDHVGSFDLDTVDPDDEMWYQDGIREEGTFTKEREDAFDNSYDVNGWLTKYIPPMFTLEGIVKDGRGRVLSAWEKYKAGLTGRYIPAYFYIETDSSRKAAVVDGLDNNLRHDPAFKATMESVVSGCLLLIKEDELEFNEVAIRNFLFKDLNIEKRFSAGNITKIVNAILKRGVAGGDPLVRVEVRGKHEAFCEKAGYKIDNKTVFLLCCDNDTYAYRAWCQHILPAIVKNNNPVKIILFTNNHVPAEARKKVKAFKNFIEYFLDASYLMVEKDYAPGWPLGELKLPVKSKPFELLGCIPQIIGKHDAYRKSYRLVDIDKY